MDIFCTLLPSHLLVLLVLLLLLPSTPQAAPPSSIKGDRKGSHRQRLCYSWKFNVEVNNLRGWSNVPDSCESYVASYMTGNGYLEDSKVAISQALDYATSYNFSLLLDTENEIGHGEGEGRRSSSSSSSSSPPLVWIFDIDETSLSNLPYYAHHHFGYVKTIPLLFSVCCCQFCISVELSSLIFPFMFYHGFGYMKASLAYLWWRKEKLMRICMLTFMHLTYTFNICCTVVE